jgi:hypothetical protein
MNLTDEFSNLLRDTANPEAIAAKTDFAAFIEYCFKDIEGNYLKLQQFHKDITNLYEHEKEVLVMAPRGGGKSIITAVALPLFRLMQNRDIRILIVSSTLSLSRHWLREIEKHMLENERYISIAGNMVPPARTLAWNDTEKVVDGRAPWATHVSLLAAGVKNSILGRRCDLAILDDIVTDDNSATEYQRSLISNWFWKTMIPILEINPRIPLSPQVIVIGTPFHQEDLYAELASKWSNK